MKWLTRRNLHVDRTASAWLIRRFLDPQAEFVFVPSGTDPGSVAGHSFDMRGGEYSHIGEQCTFEVLVERHALQSDPALVELGRIIREADVPPRRRSRVEADGLSAVMRGFQRSTPDDAEKLRLTAPLYDALYAYCQAKAADQHHSHGTARPALRYQRLVATHLEDDD